MAIKFKPKNIRYTSTFYEGIKNGFKFTYNLTERIYVTVSHKELDIRFNSLWSDIKFNSEDEVKQWCEDFKHENFSCLGEDSQ